MIWGHVYTPRNSFWQLWASEELHLKLFRNILKLSQLCELLLNKGYCVSMWWKPRAFVVYQGFYLWLRKICFMSESCFCPRTAVYYVEIPRCEVSKHTIKNKHSYECSPPNSVFETNVYEEYSILWMALIFQSWYVDNLELLCRVISQLPITNTTKNASFVFSLCCLFVQEFPMPLDDDFKSLSYYGVCSGGEILMQLAEWVFS